MRFALIALGAVLLLAVGVLYFLGRGRLEESSAHLDRPQALAGEARLQSVVLYFGDPDQVALRPEPRAMISRQTLSDRLASCLRELAQGSLTGALPVLPPQTRLIKAYLDPTGLAYLDFDRNILGGGFVGDGEEWLAVGAVVRTVCDNFPEVRRVRFMVEGEVITSLSGYCDLEEPLRAEDFPLPSERTGSSAAEGP